jgi:hypothetical protein
MGTPLPPPVPTGAGDILDEILNGPQAAAPGLTSDEMERLEKLRVNQGKSAKVIRAVLELLLEKGYTTQKDLAARLKS